MANFKNYPGTAPGLEPEELPQLQRKGGGLVVITCTDYSPSQVQIETIVDRAVWLASHRPAWSQVRWIDVSGLSDLQVIHGLATKYHLHPLAIEDVLHLSQRPKVDNYGGEDSDLQARLFLLTHFLALQENSLRVDQVSIFLGHKTVLTFQDVPSPIWEPIYQRLRTANSRLRANDASFLMYSLLDATVDRCFPLLEYFGDQAETLEDMILENTSKKTINYIHQLKRDLLLMRRVVWPLREVVSSLQREQHECISENTRVYLRDLYDHVIQIIDIIEIYREVATDLIENYMSAVSNRMNEIMKMLTIISTIFIPLTFLAGVYGMNFHVFPELDQPWAYPMFWGVCFLITVGMLLVLKRKNWL